MVPMIHAWDVYEIVSDAHSLHGVKLRGRIRKHSLESNVMCFVENASDKENAVRFCSLTDSDPAQIINFIKKILPHATVIKVLTAVVNPVLSKLKVNDESRYEIP